MNFTDPVLREMLASEYGPIFLEAGVALREDLLYRKSTLHGVGHIRRVMALGAIIAMQQKLPLRDACLLLLACSYHDIGRINDYADARHGERGSGMLEPDLIPELKAISSDELACLKAAIAAPSTDDSSITRFMAMYNGPDDMEKCCIILMKCLKDADGLDRIRFDGLDPRYLRFEESKTLLNTAEYLLTI